MRGLRTAMVAVVVCATAGSAPAQLLECRGSQRQQEVAELLFGRMAGNRIVVSDIAFDRFVAHDIAPRFPDGLTVYNAVGHWRDPTTNKTNREPTKVVHIVLPGNAEDMQHLNEIVGAYKTQFKQQGVGMVVRPACVSF
jgi:Protein of unknown function (DUF3574)